MLTPKTTTQNLLLYGVALLVSIFLAFLASLAKQLAGTDPINWRPILLDVITVIGAEVPFVVAALGLPNIGSEARALLTKRIGTDAATDALQTVALNKDNIAVVTPTTVANKIDPIDIADKVDLDALAAAILDEKQRRENVSNQPKITASSPSFISS